MPLDLESCLYVLFFLLAEFAKSIVTHGFCLSDVFWDTF